MTKRNGGGAIRVVIAATAAVRRAGLESLVRESPTLKLVGSVPSLTYLSQNLRDLQPDVLVADFDGPQVLPALPTTVPIVALIDESDAAWTAQALRSGARAILPRDSEMETILPAIQAAHAGLVLLDAEVSENLTAQIRAVPEDDLSAEDDLTPREVEVLQMLSEGLGNRQMATRLAISEHTVKFHISSILSKLGAASRTEAVTLGIRRGLILL